MEADRWGTTAVLVITVIAFVSGVRACKKSQEIRRANARLQSMPPIVEVQVHSGKGEAPVGLTLLHQV